MILIADAGSTKTDWVLLNRESENVMEFKTSGINAAQQSQSQINQVLDGIKSKIKQPEKVKKIYYYGAGCLSSKTNLKIEKKLSSIFPNAEMEINSDLIAACRALFDNGSGIVGILGTGSNSCLYVNGEIEKHIPSLGYIIGDEGSGSALGKRLISAVYKNGLVQSVCEDVISRYNLKLPEIIENVYRSGKGASYLAQFAPYILENIQEKQIKDLAVKEFDCFFEKNIKKYGLNSLPIGIVGSIGYEFQTTLREVAAKHSLIITKFLRSPMEGLITYHQND